MNSYIRLLRFRSWYAYLCIAIMGFVVARGLLGQFADIVVYFLMVSAYLGFSFAINDTFDAEEDQLNKSRNNPVATAEIDKKNAMVFSIALGLAGLLISTWFGLMIFGYQLVLTVLSFMYSAPPVRFKTRYPFDLLSHGFFFGALILLLPALIFGPITNVVILLTISIFTLSLTIELWNHISDHESDMEANMMTTVSVLGFEKSEKIAMILSLAFSATLLPLYYDNGFILMYIFATGLYLFLILWKRSPTFLYSYANLLYGHIMVLEAISYLL